MGKKYEYVAVHANGRHTVTARSLIHDLRELENGFMFKVGDVDHYSPYFFVTTNLEAAWKFARGAEADESKRQQNATILGEHFPLCPDRL